jgi:hypothetical protein
VATPLREYIDTSRKRLHSAKDALREAETQLAEARRRVTSRRAWLAGADSLQQRTVAVPPWNRADQEDLGNIEAGAIGVLTDGEPGTLAV